MQGFRDVVGHQEIIEHLQNAISMDKVSHAYLFGGESGSGKKLLASLFAMTLQCEQHGVEPCMECSSCRKAASKNHPDIIYITHEKPNTISIDEIREQLINDVAIRPYESPYKIYIIEEAQKMTLQAQNALLKTIEEPPAYAIILLLADNPDALLPTITSRCVQLNLKPVGTQMVKNYLMERMHIPDYQAEVDASLAQGNIGKAERIAGSPEYAEVMENALKLMRYSDTMQLHEIVEAIRKLTEEKNNIEDYLDIFSVWFRDVLLFKATREVDTLVFKQEINSIRERAKKSSYEGLEKIIDAIGKARVRLKANVNFDLTMELLFLTIKEN
ncbi:MAG: DNA polymerase III subunit delta' [Lachnospiraceae bacterium]|nr:DNA polymerase III subunit delta' [Lachnospiraceae bacterium]